MTSAPIHLDLQSDNGRRQRARCARRIGYVAGGFILLVAAIMLVTIVREEQDNPLTAGTIDNLKSSLIADGTNESLKDSIRQADQRVREVYFHRRTFLMHGAWLMLGGALVLAVSMKLAANWGASAYTPTGPAPAGHRWGLAMKIGMAAMTVILGGLLAALATSSSRAIRFADAARAAADDGGDSKIKTSNPATTTVAAIDPTAPSDEEFARNWPNFRGPGAAGIAIGDYPIEWNAASEKNLLWRVPIAQSGKGSPVIWNDRVFLTGGTSDRREVACYDAATGALKWACPIGAKVSAGLELNEATGYAPASPATDGRRVFAMVPTGELAAVDFNGKVVWSKNFGKLANLYGHATSLVVSGGNLIVQLDQGQAKENLSAIMALDAATGKPIWKTARPVGASWSTPMIVKSPAGPQIIALGDPWVMAYDPTTGAELWRATGLGGEVTPSPAFAAGTVYAAVERADLLAIRIDGKGDVSKTHAKKLEADILPDIVSLAAYNDRVLLVSTGGSVTLVDSKLAKTVWTQDIEGGFNASPVVAGSRAYLTDLKGVTHIFDLATPAFKELGRGEVGQEVAATPAMVAGRIYIRGHHELFCIAAERGAK